MVAVNGSRVDASPNRLGYVTLDRVWTNGDVITVELPVAPRHRHRTCGGTSAAVAQEHAVDCPRL
jgi:DUF1680 family protein